ncbi:MAG: alpha/beta hydrolase [Planctomycetes bacterium]|nr:alpha/beta hydrolase [Planctomycetota bacterium]
MCIPRPARRRLPVPLALALALLLLAGCRAPAPSAPVDVHYATDRAPDDREGFRGGYGGARSPTLRVGTRSIRVALDAETGEQAITYVAPWNPPPADAAVAAGDASAPTDPAVDPIEALRARLARAPGRDVFLHIHGYGTDFEEALYRTGQLAWAFGRTRTPLLFSWPSRGRVGMYTPDEAAAEWASYDLRRLLEAIAPECAAPRIHVIAHSLGSRALCWALAALGRERAPGAGPRFGEIVLAAPDLDADVLARTLPDLAGLARRITLYQANNDVALRLSSALHAAPRAGDSHVVPFLAPGVVTIDVTEIQEGVLGHAYFILNRRVRADLAALLDGRTEEERGLTPIANGAGARAWKIPAPGGTTDGLRPALYRLRGGRGD